MIVYYIKMCIILLCVCVCVQGMVTVSGLVAFMVNLSIFWIIGKTSPLTYVTTAYNIVTMAYSYCIRGPSLKSIIYTNTFWWSPGVHINEVPLYVDNLAVYNNTFAKTARTTVQHVPTLCYVSHVPAGISVFILTRFHCYTSLSYLPSVVQL